MPKIKILSADVANKIAAGEVVERPASVVKELIENAVDAESTLIRVEVRAGGKRLIHVSDNGSGMEHEDALLALERHATSKVNRIEDLEQIQTFGFRGEALASIASVSQFELLTRTSDALMGTKVNADGGGVRSVQESGCSPGTHMSVNNLFYNVPARLKFLKNRYYRNEPRYESGNMDSPRAPEYPIFADAQQQIYSRCPRLRFTFGSEYVFYTAKNSLRILSNLQRNCPI